MSPEVLGEPSRGRMPLRPGPGEFAVAEEKAFAGAGVRALRGDAPEAIRRPMPLRGGPRTLWLVEEGGGVAHHTAPAAFRSGDTVVFPAAADVSIALSRYTRVLEISLDAGGPWWPPALTVAAATAASVAAAAMASALLRAAPPVAAREIEHVRALVDAAAMSTVLSLPAGGTPADPLARKADALIAEHAHDPAFTVATLAAMLSVSRRHLTRVLSQDGRAPALRIRDVRVARVRAAEAVYGDELVRDDLLARWFGFVSARALRETLARARVPPG